MQQFNFSTQEASEALALLVSVAETVTNFDISYQDTTRPVRVEVTPATTSSQANADDGSVIVYNLVTNELIVSVTSSRTSTPAFYYVGTYNSIEFTIDTADIFINGVLVIGESSAQLSTPITATCNTLWQ